ncbi:hypothetical protein GTG28_20745 [Vibrio sp. OCN044]|uniref:Uncharacterized protein n=1 Tax=Vibrio tetraodonis subsp. pristinus TaxID=2695891 RepID=A0A6L8M1A1_9VIBR|nr:hypothetical protein [Vibrio tetraodonis]MYM61633.1 hypothetical protein [Vibrio tetraodonis subsp. pristinus]
MSKLRTDLILAADGDPETPVRIPSLEKRMAFAIAEYNGQSTKLNYSYNISTITYLSGGAHHLKFISKPVRDTYAATVTIDAIQGLPYGVQVDQKSLDGFRVETYDSGANRGVPTVNAVVHGGD